MSGLALEINPALSPAQYADQYVAGRRIHIPQFLTTPSVRALVSYIESFRNWNLHLNDGNKHFDIHPNQRIQMSAEYFSTLRKSVDRGATHGFQYIFENFPIYDAWHAGTCPQPLSILFEFLNSEPFLSFARVLTGFDDIEFADAQLTKYSKGDFLTVHNDDVQGKNRRAAYVLNLTTQWRADWGGLLQFHASNGHISDAYTPCFNALNVFSVPQPHSVSQVSTFAPRSRYSVTGWLRTG